MSIIRSFVFWIFLYLSIALLVILYFPFAFFIKRKTFADECAKFWSMVVFWLLRFVLKINYKVVGLNNLPKGASIIACKHHSMWETVIFHLLCKHPAYVYKKELLNVPFYGWYVNKMSGVKVDRSGGASALKDLIKQAKNLIATGHNIIIFPQGTRVPPEASVEQYPYQVGIAALYLACGVDVVPVALNSGNFWGKSMWIKKTGCVTIEFLEPIKPGLSKLDFMTKLAEKIEVHSSELRRKI